MAPFIRKLDLVQALDLALVIHVNVATNNGAVDGDLYIMVDGVVTVPYARVLIRNKHPEKGDE